MSEELLQTPQKQIGRYSYYKLGNTTLRQLKKAKIINRIKKELQDKKPDGLIVLPGGSTKAVIEYKQPSELSTTACINQAISQEIDVARLLCKLLIVTDGTRTFWINALNGRRIIKNGKPVTVVFDGKKLLSGELSIEEIIDLENLIDQAEYSLTETNDNIVEPEVLDPTPLAKEVWQKIWISTGKEPEKCLYNVVEIFVFKFLSDIGVLDFSTNFHNVYNLKEKISDETALRHYADRSRKEIRNMFPEGDDGTSIINGTIFVNEKGEPNITQAILFGQVLDSFQKYDEENGSFKYVKKEFKTRLYETFLRQSAGEKNLGRYFTPRNVVQAMVKMSNVNSINVGARICDPFCGVGGFILEIILLYPSVWKEFEPKNQKLKPQIALVGYDKGTDEKEDDRTIILAKANMLIYFSDLLSKYHSAKHLEEFSKNAFNKVFHLLRSNLGTFELTTEKPFDIIITNPPYVTSGSSSLKDALQKNNLLSFYSAGGRGTESLAIEWIIKNLKQGGQALIIVPDGLMNQLNMLNYIKRNCHVQAIISLPKRTFYATPKKTYILILQKKTPIESQEKPVFTYLVSEIGETRDFRRFPIPENNDLDEAVKLFKLYKYDIDIPHSERCKLINFDDFNEYNHWMIERLWSDEEKKTLGVLEELQELSEDDFFTLITDIRDFINEQLKGINDEDKKSNSF